MINIPRPVVLVVLDGFGVSREKRGNAVLAAEKPNLGFMEKNFPFTALQASGTAVGLPWGEAGNSEVGHLTMGAGRVIYNHLPRIITAIKNGSFYENQAFLKIISHVKENNSALHLLGLVSSGSVHSYIDHLYALMELAHRQELGRVYIHAVTDGKDAPRDEAAKIISQLEERIREKGYNITIASLIGRFYAMDRDEKWERIRASYELLTKGRGAPFINPADSIRASYERGVYDESIEPAYLEENGEAVGRVRDGDGLIIFNFREDSVREITQAFAKNFFDDFGRERLANLKVATMTEYGKNIPEAEVAFPPLEINWPLGRVLSEAGRTQLHIAESEKYAHVTYFFNGGKEKPFLNEDRMMVPSLGVPHFDDHPEMKAAEITQKILDNLERYDFILANFANSDMVGHTGNFKAVVKAVEVLDEAIGRITPEVLKKSGVLIITADHGNAEQKIHPLSGEPVTEHTSNPVPFYLVGEQFRLGREQSQDEIAEQYKETKGILIDVAPTILELMRLPQPPEMTGKSLLPTLLNR